MEASSPGAMTHCAHAISDEPLQLFDSQPLHAIHFALGATPIWFAPPSLPTIVPIVWLPWPMLSQGVPPQILAGSDQFLAWLNPTPVLPRYWFTKAGCVYCTP